MAASLRSLLSRAKSAHAQSARPPTARHCRRLRPPRRRPPRLPTSLRCRRLSCPPGGCHSRHPCTVSPQPPPGGETSPAAALPAGRQPATAAATPRLVNFACQSEDLDGGRSAWAAGSGRRRPMGLVASSAAGGATEGRPGGERTGLADFVSLRLKGGAHGTNRFF